MFSQTFPRRPSFFEVTTASSFPVEKTFCPRLLSGRCVPPARTPPKAVGGGQREAAAGSRRWREVRRQLTIHNSLFTIQHFSSTTPLTNLAYPTPLVKRHGVRGGVPIWDVGPGLAPARPSRHGGRNPPGARHESKGSKGPQRASDSPRSAGCNPAQGASPISASRTARGGVSARHSYWRAA